MVRAKFLMAAIISALGLGMVWYAQAVGQEFKGQVKIGVHRVKLEPNKLYEITLDGPKDSPLNVNAQGVQLIHAGSDFRNPKTYVMPNQPTEAVFLVTPSFGPGNFTTYDYVLKIKGAGLSEKPLLQESGQWTAQDPVYKERGSGYKDYKINLKAGKLYVIDLVKGGLGPDPYLYLESPTGMVVARDDDSGGDLNARIIYAPPQDSEFRIIATTLNKATGGFTLTVRQAE
jgi:hypothetical protein